MDYEKKYKEALTRAESFYRNGKGSTKSMVYTIFPELKESEDERIRKWLICTLKSLNNSSVQIDGAYEMMLPAIAWLEKRCQTFTKKDVDDAYLKGVCDAKHELEKQGEQKHDPCEHCEDKYLNCHNFPCITKREFEQGKSAIEAIKEEKVDNATKVEHKPSWSEEDEEMLKMVINSCGQCGNEYAYSWLKSIKDRVLPQILTVTDEELAQAKKDAYNGALDKIEYHSEEPTFDDGWSAAIWYLKKRNAQPQNTWKPSDKQIKALNEAIYHVDDSIATQIAMLIGDLKKLREV